MFYLYRLHHITEQQHYRPRIPRNLSSDALIIALMKESDRLGISLHLKQYLSSHFPFHPEPMPAPKPLSKEFVDTHSEAECRETVMLQQALGITEIGDALKLRRSLGPVPEGDKSIIQLLFEQYSGSQLGEEHLNRILNRYGHMVQKNMPGALRTLQLELNNGNFQNQQDFQQQDEHKKKQWIRPHP